MNERPDQDPIASPRSQRVRRIAALSGRSARRREGRIRVEGPQAVRALLEARPELALEVHVTARADADHPELADAARAADIPVRPTEDAIIRAMVREDAAGAGALVSPQGVIALARQPETADPAAALAALPASGPVTLLVLHEVRDPGNVGTLIRTADAAGADAVILTPTCADPFGPKAIRASVGSVFHLPLVQGAAIDGLLPALREHGIASAATSGYADAELFAAPLPERIAWILGNEARGLDEQTLAAAELAIRIPLEGRAESLNVHTAATVCLFETLRRRRASGSGS